MVRQDVKLVWKVLNVHPQCCKVTTRFPDTMMGADIALLKEGINVAYTNPKEYMREKSRIRSE
jgi:hypothetical protein